MPKTLQETFDFVATHLITQGEKAMRLDADQVEYCAYRGADGLTCAVGCLIPDDLYYPDMEGSSVFGLCAEAHFHLGEDNLRALFKLQVIHDTAHPSYWASNLRVLATKLDLSPAALDAAVAAKKAG